MSARCQLCFAPVGPTAHAVLRIRSSLQPTAAATAAVLLRRSDTHTRDWGVSGWEFLFGHIVLDMNKVSLPPPRVSGLAQVLGLASEPPGEG